MTRKLAAYAAGLMACSSFTAPAFAQDADELAAPDANDSVIIVTATRRASDVQDIPIAVTAVTPQQLDQQGIVNIQTLGAVAPSFNIQSSQTESQGTSIRIRGIGTTGNNIGLESAVGVFIDGVYQSRPGIALGELVDVQQVEVLRGPQGTLFGRNTTAGALVVRNRAPDLNAFGGFAQATYGNYNFINVQGAVNTPVSESLGFRFTGAYRERDGILTDADGTEVNDRDRYMVRGQMLWEPSADISLRVIADYQESNELCCDSITLNPPSSYSDAFNALAFPNGFSQSFQPAATGQTRIQSLNGDDLVSNGNGISNDVEQWGISGELVWNIGETEFTALVAYRDFLGTSTQDDFQGIQNYSVGGVTEDILPPTFDDIQTFTAEARLQGTAFNDTLDWLVGVYYADEDIVEEASLTLGPDFQTFVGQASFGAAVGPLAPAILGLIAQSGAYLNSVLAGAPDVSVFAPGSLSADNSFGLNRYSQQGESFSVFTHNIVNVTDTLSLTFGLRYVDDKKDGQYNQLDANNPACLASLTTAGFPQADAFALLEPILGAAVAGAVTTPALNGPGAFLNCFPFAAPALGVSFLPAEFDLTFEDDEFIYTGQIGWEPNPDLLTYASFTHGYKAGGFNLDSTAAASGGDPRFRSEEIDAYELGIKATLLDGRARANFAFFYNELQDFQVLEFTGTQFQTFNVDDVTAKGFEAEFFSQWNPYLSNSLAVTYTDASYGDACDATFVAAGGPNPALGLCNTPLTNAPKWTTVFGMTYDGPLFSDDGWDFLANVNVRHESERRTSTRGQTSTLAPVPFDFQDSNFKINARIGFSSPDDSIGIEFWGRNLTNEITRSITFNTPLAGDSRSAFVEEPRTYGVTVRTRF